MDYEIKARLAQVSPTMPASVQHNPCLNRQGEAERKKRYERQREKEREGNKGQTTHQQTQFQQIPPFSSSLHFSARVSSHSCQHLGPPKSTTFVGWWDSSLRKKAEGKEGEEDNVVRNVRQERERYSCWFSGCLASISNWSI